jgi:hypothetical protein
MSERVWVVGAHRITVSWTEGVFVPSMAMNGETFDASQGTKLAVNIRQLTLESWKAPTIAINAVVEDQDHAIRLANVIDCACNAYWDIEAEARGLR